MKHNFGVDEKESIDITFEKIIKEAKLNGISDNVTAEIK